MSRVLLDTKILTTSANNINSATIAPTAGRVIVMACATRLSADNTHTPTDTFGGLSWTQISRTQNAGAHRVRLSIAYAVVPVTPGSHEVGFNFSGTSARRLLAVWEADYDTTTPVRQSTVGAGVTATTPSLTLPSAPLTANEVIGLFGSTGLALDVAAGDGGGGGDAFAEDEEIATAVGTNDLTLFTEARTGAPGVIVNASALGTINNVGIAVEFNMAVGGGSPPDGDPTLLTATAVSAERIDLAWTRGSTNNDSVLVQRAPDVAGSPGAFTTIDTLGAAVVTYQNTGLSQTTKYHFQVIESNADGDSDPSNVDDATTLSRPVVTRVDPTGATRTLPVLGLSLGAIFDFEFGATDAEDGALSGASVDVTLDGVPFGTGLTHSIDVDVDLVTEGTHTLVAVATDSDGDESDPVGYNLIVSAPGAAIKILTEAPLFDTPVLFGTGVTVRGLKFRGPDGNFVNPTFAAGDVKVIKDGTDVGDATNLPILQVRNEHHFTADESETDGEQTVYTFADQTDPPVWVPVTARLLTYGNPAAYYPEPLPELGSDNRQLISADTHVSGLEVEALASAERTALITALFTQASTVAPNVSFELFCEAVLAAAVGLASGFPDGPFVFKRISRDAGTGALSSGESALITGTASEGNRTAVALTPA